MIALARHLLTMWRGVRSSRALDERNGGAATREHALVHAALRDTAGHLRASTERVDAQDRMLRARAILERVQRTSRAAPLPWWRARAGVLVTCLVLGVGGIATWAHVAVHGQGWRLEAMPVVRTLLMLNAEERSQGLRSPGLHMTDDAVLACAEAPLTDEQLPWMSAAPGLAQREHAALAMVELRESREVGRAMPRAAGSELALGGGLLGGTGLDEQTRLEVMAIKEELEAATRTVLSRLPGQSEPK